MRCSMVIPALACALVFPSLASAQPAPPPPKPDEDIAADLVDKGLRHYDLREYDQALQAFQTAYTLAPNPELFYLMANAHRGKVDCAQALEQYSKYLAEAPAGEFRTEAEQYVESMKACVDAQAPPPVDPPPAVAPPPTPVEPGAPRGRTKKIIGLIAAGAGVLALATGVYFGLEAQARADEVAAFIEAGGGEWGPDQQAIEEAGESAESKAIILYSIGGAALIGGGVMYWLGWREGRQGRPAVSVGPGEAQLGWAWTF